MSSESDPDVPNELRREFALLRKEALAPSIQLTESFRQKAWKFFDEHKGDHDPGAAGDAFFSYVAAVWQLLLGQGRLEDADTLWLNAVRIAREWEQSSGSLLHKGTAYYFWGGTAVMKGNFRMGFALMHSGLEEDRRKHPGGGLPDSPAYKFVTLDSISDDQFLRPTLEFATRRLEESLKNYREATESNLTYREFRDYFLKEPDLREIVFVFSLAVFERFNLDLTFEALDFSGGSFLSQLCANTLFDLCQVVEETIRHKNPSPGAFKHQAHFLMEKKGWDTGGNPLDKVNAAQMTNFDACVSNLLQGKKVASRTPKCTTERDLWLTYVLRNSTGHDLAGKKVIAQDFYSLFQAVINTLFMATETLYR